MDLRTISGCALGFALSLLGGCADIACQGNRVPDGDRCRCPDGTRDERHACVPEVAAPPTAKAPTEPPGACASSCPAGTSCGPNGSCIATAPMTPTTTPGATSGTTTTPGPTTPGATTPGPTPSGTTPGSTTPGATSPGVTSPAGSTPTTTVAAVCGNGVREGSELCDDGNDIPYDRCVGCKPAHCGDGFIQPDADNPEDCEENANSPGLLDVPEVASRLWTAKTCSFATCKRKIYTRCSANAQCPEGTCQRGVCLPASCLPDTTCPLPPCPIIPGYKVHVELVFCMVECNAGGTCPLGLHCEENGTLPSICVGDAGP